MNLWDGHTSKPFLLSWASGRTQNIQHDFDKVADDGRKHHPLLYREISYITQGAEKQGRVHQTRQKNKGSPNRELAA